MCDGWKDAQHTANILTLIVRANRGFTVIRQKRVEVSHIVVLRCEGTSATSKHARSLLARMGIGSANE
ncbi:MAG: hypothetical protein WCE82_07990 [Halobacteriota archaeon]